MVLALHVAGHAVSLPLVVALGAVVGYVAGMFGVGGGFLLTPMLVVLLGVPLPIAVGSGLCQLVGMALVALLRHRGQGQGELRVDVLMLPGALLGTEAGARTLTALSSMGSVTVRGRAVPLASVALEAAYALLLCAIAALFWRQGSRGTSEPLAYVRVGPLARVRLGPAVDLPAVPLWRVSSVLLAELGLALGFLSGLLGIGGGVALMPVLIYGYGFPMRQAAGTGILVLCATAVSGTVAHALRGNVHLGLAMALLVGSSLSAQLGALATRSAAPYTLRRAFAGVVLCAVVALAWDLMRTLW